MTLRRIYVLLAALALLAAGACGPTTTSATCKNKAIKAAVAQVAPCVVQIETQGGTDMVRGAGGGMIRHGLGPTSGLVVSPDGYIISSAFNFANKPTTIDVSVPGKKNRYPGQGDRHRPDAHADAPQNRGSRPARADARRPRPT